MDPPKKKKSPPQQDDDEKVASLTDYSEVRMALKVFNRLPLVIRAQKVRGLGNGGKTYTAVVLYTEL